MTGIVTVDFAAPSRDLSITLNREILASANNFLQERRQARAEGETKFMESRLSEARSQLAVAEAALRDFVSQNRQYETSPQLSLQYAQLDRNVNLKQQVFVTLSQNYEQARIEAMRNVSLISVMQRPEYAIARRVPSLFRNILLALVVGVLVAMGLVVARTKLAREPLDNPADVEEFRALLRAAVPNPVRRGRRKLRGGSIP
jgi:tyrosine-protein kinase Etk/Wzc